MRSVAKHDRAFGIPWAWYFKNTAPKHQRPEWDPRTQVTFNTILCDGHPYFDFDDSFFASKRVYAAFDVDALASDYDVLFSTGVLSELPRYENDLKKLSTATLDSPDDFKKTLSDLSDYFSKQFPDESISEMGGLNYLGIEALNQLYYAAHATRFASKSNVPLLHLGALLPLPTLWQGNDTGTHRFPTYLELRESLEKEMVTISLPDFSVQPLSVDELVDIRAHLTASDSIQKFHEEVGEVVLQIHQGLKADSDLEEIRRRCDFHLDHYRTQFDAQLRKEMASHRSGLVRKLIRRSEKRWVDLVIHVASLPFSLPSALKGLAKEVAGIALGRESVASKPVIGFMLDVNKSLTGGLRKRY